MKNKSEIGRLIIADPKRVMDELLRLTAENELLTEQLSQKLSIKEAVKILKPEIDKLKAEITRLKGE